MAAHAETPLSGVENGSGPSAERLVRDLLRPEAYQALESRERDVGFLETHISRLFFAGDRVYKLKKAVDLGFLDYTSLERRRHFCEEEVRLNRRLAPEIYLGVVPITHETSGRLQVGGQGAVVEWAVEMKRLPSHRMFAALAERGEVDNEKMNELARLLVDFHEQARTGPGVDEFGSLAVIRGNVEENFEQLASFVSGAGSDGRAGVLTSAQFDFLSARSAAFLRANGPLLERRIGSGRIREGHGDLHAGNLCFTDSGVVAYDCIEFNERFRCGDVAADLAFLAMDLDYRGYPGFSRYLTKRYGELSDDGELGALLPFYKGYRAIVRGKVAAFLSADENLSSDKRHEARSEAMRYLQLAAMYELPPALVLMCGLPASGKSWLAKRLARSMGAAVLRSDVRRKRLAGMPRGGRDQSGYGEGLYAPAERARTYRSLLVDALSHLRHGHPVIVDATFSKREYRMSFVDAVERLELPYYVVHVEADEELIRARMAERATDKAEASDADLAVYLREKESFEPPSEVPSGHVSNVVSGAGLPEDESSVVVDRMIAITDGMGAA